MENKKIIIHPNPDMAEMIPWYLEKLDEYSKTINEALEKRDFETIEVIGHRMKGSGVTYGFDGISDMGLSLEQAAKANNSKDVLIWAGELSHFLKLVEVV